MAFASARVSRVEHGLSLLPGLEERWCLDLYPALNLPASSTASRPGRLSLSRHYGRPVGKDHRTRRHSRIRCAQARERPQAPYFGGHPRAADRMQSGASRHLRPKGGCPVARWPEAIFPNIGTVIADAGHQSRKLARHLLCQDGWKLQIVKRRQRAFKITGLTWIVERSFAWLGRNRRLSKDYEYCVQSSETLIEIAATRLMLNRLAQA